MGHAHLHDHVDVVSRRTRRVLATVVGVIGLLTALGMALLWPGPIDTRAADELGLVSEVYPAEVEAVRQVPCSGTRPSDGVDCDRVRYRLLAGPDQGERRTIEFPVSDISPEFGPGDEIVLSYRADAEPRFQYDYSDRQRRSPLLLLAVVFVVAVVLLARFRGVLALLGLAASIAVLLVFILPALLEGTSPVLVAIVGASAIAFLALFLAHGFRPMTLVALLGTLVALALTVALAAVFTEVTQLTGFATEEAILVKVGQSGLDVRGIVLAGMVIGALGALDDMTVTQSAAIAELRAADPSMSRRSLTRAGLRIGRDHVASTVNTLALAYAGAAMPLLILFVLAQQSLGTVVNSEIVAVEVVRTLVGSIGLVAAVPVTTWLAARAVAGPAPTGGRGGEPPWVPTDEVADEGSDGDGPKPGESGSEPAGAERPASPPESPADFERRFWSR